MEANGDDTAIMPTMEKSSMNMDESISMPVDL